MRQIRKVTSIEARQIVLKRARDATRPLLAGQVALDLDVSLKEAEFLMKEMVTEGTMRSLTQAELRDYDLHDGYRAV